MWQPWSLLLLYPQNNISLPPSLPLWQVCTFLHRVNRKGWDPLSLAGLFLFGCFVDWVRCTMCLAVYIDRTSSDGWVHSKWSTIRIGYCIPHWHWHIVEKNLYIKKSKMMIDLIGSNLRNKHHHIHLSGIDNSRHGTAQYVPFDIILWYVLKTIYFM